MLPCKALHGNGDDGNTTLPWIPHGDGTKCCNNTAVEVMNIAVTQRAWLEFQW